MEGIQTTEAEITNLPALAVSGLSKHFGPVAALHDVNLEIMPGEIHALVGLNGSGKSTLIKCLSGFYRPDHGSVHMNGRPVRLPASTSELQSLGLSFMHQDLGLVDGMSILDNVRVGRYRTRLGRIAWTSERRLVAVALSRFGVRRGVDEKVAVLAPWQRAVVGMVRALQVVEDGGRPGVLVLDEPTVALPDHEVEMLFAAVRQVAEMGTGVLFVSHRTEEVLALSNRASVLRGGRLIDSRPTASISSSDLIHMIVGRDLGELYPSNSHGDTGPVRMTVEGLSGGGVENVSFAVAAGEIVGLTGLVGAGHHDVPYLLYGAQHATGGAIHVAGKHISKPSPPRCQKQGLVLVPGDRARQSALNAATTRENLTTTSLSKYKRRAGALDSRNERRHCARLIEEFQIYPKDPEHVFSGLSGGNQQKAILARVMQGSPQVFLLDEPTQGVDVGAKKRIFEIISRCAQQGAAVVYASVEHEDLAHLCDRVLVFHGGRVGTSLSGNQLTKENLLKARYAAPTVQ